MLGLAWWIRGREQKAPAEPKPVKMAENNTVVEATWNDVQLEDSLGMEVGYRLIPMVDFQQDGELLGRIRSIRKKFAQEMGFLPPVVHIRDNMDLQPARYRILMKGVEMGSGDAYPGRWLAINPGTAAGTLPVSYTHLDVYKRQCKNSSTLINSRKSRMPPASIISARPCVNWH